MKTCNRTSRLARCLILNMRTLLKTASPCQIPAHRWLDRIWQRQLCQPRRNLQEIQVKQVIRRGKLRDGQYSRLQQFYCIYWQHSGWYRIVRIMDRSQDDCWTETMIAPINHCRVLHFVDLHESVATCLSQAAMSTFRVSAHECNPSLGATLKLPVVDGLARACIWSWKKNRYPDEVAMSLIIAEYWGTHMSRQAQDSNEPHQIVAIFSSSFSTRQGDYMKIAAPL